MGCEVCLKQYVLSSQNPKVKCPVPDCGKLVCLADLEALLSQEEMTEHFLRQKVPFLEANKTFYKQCPTPDCENLLCSPTGTDLAQVTDVLSKGVVFCDSCGNDYCFECLRNHYDTDCKGNKVKEQAAQSSVIVKKCPSCRNPVPMEENGDHLSCKHCKTQFCGLCSEDFGRNAEIYEINIHLLEHHGRVRTRADQPTFNAAHEHDTALPTFKQIDRD